MAIRTRNVLCLAASLKHGGFCYAGKDVDTEEWVRPISDDEGHAIPAYYRVVGKNDPAKVGDVLSMKLGAAAGEGYQSENCAHVKEHWRRIGTADFDQIRAAVDDPDSLWGEGRSSKHGIRDDLTEQQANGFDFSLCLIEVQDLIIVCADEGFNVEKIRVRARFTYRGVVYKLTVTDPEHFGYDVGEHPVGNALLCCSLTEPYEWQDGSRHASKLVAAIITRDRLA